MLPLSLKVVWLVFAALGLFHHSLFPFSDPHHVWDSHPAPSPLKGVPATWVVFIRFASAIGTYWASILYCITVTILEITFCLGTCQPLLGLSHVQ